MNKSLRALFLLPVMCLAACGKETIVGTYAFRLGKQGAGETKIGLSIQLTDQDFKVKDEVAGKTFVAKMALGSDLELGDDIEKILEKGITGYYNKKNVTTKYGNRLALGAVFDHAHFPDVIPEGTVIELPPELLQYAAVTYINNRDLTLQIPVSLTDLQHQLVWYGYYLNLESFNYPLAPLMTDLHKFLAIGEKLPGKYQDEDRFGSHPLKEYDENGILIANDVVDMNNRFSRVFSNTFVYTSNVNVTEKQVVGKIIYDNFEKKYSYFKDADVPISTLGQIDASLYDAEENKFVDVILTLDKVDYETSGYSLITASAYKSDPTKAFDIAEVFEDPFVFRDFHDIKMGLMKE